MKARRPSVVDLIPAASSCFIGKLAKNFGGTASDQTRGHGMHTLAAVWKHHLVELLKNSERSRN